MNPRLLLIVVATGLLSGCAWTWLEKPEPEEPGSRLIGIGWGGHEWRTCVIDATCPRPTPKTVILSTARPVAIIPQKLPEISAEATSKTSIAHQVRFPFARSIPTTEGFVQLNRILREIRETHAIHITGHTDDIGGHRFNERLARRRAEFVSTWLKQQGIRVPMEIEARGKCCYLTTNDTDDGRAANRRVEIVLRDRQRDLTNNKTSTTKKESDK